MSVHESGEMYLEAILVLGKSGNLVRSVDVGEYLGYSKPSVSRAMGILRKENYITVQKNGGLVLTEKGRTLAETIYERHTGGHFSWHFPKFFPLPPPGTVPFHADCRWWTG